MKRSGIQRKTPMKSGSSLRSTPPAQGSGKPAAPRRTGKHVGVNEARRLVKERSGGQCEIHMVGCYEQATDWHHRQLRSQGGKWEVRNGIHACRFCHEAVTNTRGHRAEYEANGWLVRSHLDPAAVEVLLRHNGREDWFLLREDGGVDLAPFPKGVEGHPDDLGVPRVDPWDRRDSA